MKYFFYKLLGPRPSFPADMTPAEAKLMNEHVAYWAGHMKEGRVVALGPVADPRGTYGICIIRLQDNEDPKALCAGDPVVAAQVGFGFEVHPMPHLLTPE